jgi:hypothetical protein
VASVQQLDGEAELQAGVVGLFLRHAPKRIQTIPAHGSREAGSGKECSREGRARRCPITRIGS